MFRFSEEILETTFMSKVMKHLKNTDMPIELASFGKILNSKMCFMCVYIWEIPNIQYKYLEYTFNIEYIQYLVFALKCTNRQ